MTEMSENVAEAFAKHRTYASALAITPEDRIAIDDALDEAQRALYDAIADEVRGPLEARIERLRLVGDAAYELVYHPEHILESSRFDKGEWLRTQLDHLEPGDLTDNGGRHHDRA
jgi:hypothetical protein